MATIFYKIIILSCLFCGNLSQENESYDSSSEPTRNDLEEYNCSQATQEKEAYFVNPETFSNVCNLIVTPFSENVCQIRLQFENFSTAQPTQLDSGSSWQCNVDAFTVGTLTGGINLGFKHLCGENTGQHIYIPVTSSGVTGSISLNFVFAGRTSGETITPEIPEWRIKITQLECPLASDSALIAPPGCLQYYPEKTGAYESFNYNSNRTISRYIGQMNYAICFRRTPDVCGMRHTPENFEMSWTLDSKNVTDCFGASAKDEDYFLIPNGIFNIPNPNRTGHRDIFCDNMLPAKSSVTTSTAGPLFVGVRHDDIGYPDATQKYEIGFRFNYELLSTGCQTFKQL